ncbi:MAG: type IV toxin-antitoxin system AbiEi family antitoxin [Deltaproteobacteria bacterium]|nr:type IV toxin-antitoxin system AbiEi family antitoxin [Deltaproteobacteria bacterium]
MDLAKHIDELASQGRYHVTTVEVRDALGISIVAARAALRRLRAKGAIAMPFNGFHVIVPPEYRRIGCLPADQFVPQLMNHLGLDYYVGLLSAAEYHGAAHHRPQTFQVIVAINRRPIECGDVRVRFFARRNVQEIPTIAKNTPRGIVRISTPEATAFDLVGYAERAGGMDHVATVLTELVEAINADELAHLAPLSPVSWSQRLGHLLEIVGAENLVGPLAEYVAENARQTIPLNPKRRSDDGDRNVRWKLQVNDTVEPEQ